MLCQTCQLEKTSTEFYFRNDSQKYRPDCKSCQIKIVNKHYYNNQDRIRGRVKVYKTDNPQQLLLTHAKTTAKRKQLPYNLDLSDISIPPICPFLNMPLTNIQGQGFVASNISIDRIDSTKGYVKGNIQIISRQANSMKNSATKDQLITFAKSILRMENIK